MTLKYKDYSGSIQLDQEARVFHGEILGIDDVVTFEGRTADEVLQAFKDSVDDYLDFCQQQGEEPEKAFSGRFVVRMPAALHRDAAIAAQAAGQSLNSWMVDCVKRDLSQKSWIEPRTAGGVPSMPALKESTEANKTISE